MELERRGVQDLASTIGAASHLSSSNGTHQRGKARRLATTKVGETRTRPPKKDKPPKDKWKGKKDEA